MTRQERFTARARRLEAAVAITAAVLAVLLCSMAPSAGGANQAPAATLPESGGGRPTTGAAPWPTATATAGASPGVSAGASPGGSASAWSGGSAGTSAGSGSAAAGSGSGGSGPGPGAPASSGASPLKRSVPTRVRIPQVGIDVRVLAADREPDGSPPVPSKENAMSAAWYSGGPSPGERGPALLVGHLDTEDGPAAFAGLGALRRGADVLVERKDGGTVRFTVDSVELFSKSRFPNGRVYGDTTGPELRLITCGGTWSKAGGYDSNIVVFAHLAGRGS